MTNVNSAKTIIAATAAAAALAATDVTAGGVDLSRQDISLIFEQGNVGRME